MIPATGALASIAGALGFLGTRYQVPLRRTVTEVAVLENAATAVPILAFEVAEIVTWEFVLSQ